MNKSTTVAMNSTKRTTPIRIARVAVMGMT
jgi:hypothetical protein